VTGETWGSSKAEGWKPEAPQIDESALCRLQSELESLDGEIGDLQQQIGAMANAQQAARARAQQISTLREQASHYARATERVLHAQAQYDEFAPKVEALRARAGKAPAGVECTCPECGALLRYLTGALRAASADAVPDEEAIARLPEYERSLTVLANALANAKAEVKRADEAATQLRALEEAADDSTDVADANSLQTDLDARAMRRRELLTAIEKLRDAQRAAAAADQAANDAANHHAEVLAWDAIADALSPDGIPADLLREALGPINSELAALAELSEWAAVTITPDMEILSQGRPYALLSESAQWRADAHIACAISIIAGLRLLVLDRADLLIGQERDRLFYWLDDLAYTDKIDTALVFMSLREPPKALPDGIEAFWIEHGVVRSPELAAA